MGNNREQLSVRGRGLTRALNVFIFVILTILIASCSDSDSPKTTSTDPRPPGATEGSTFNETHYRVSHNSYSGNQDSGYRGGITQQLDAGLRFVELDIHLQSDSPPFFKIGHSHPEQYVEINDYGNPDDYNAKAWISVVKDWVQKYQPTEPVILAFDWKSGFDKDNEEDQLAIQTLHGYFADSIYLFPKDFDAENTPVSQYAGRIMVVLSGEENARKYYSDAKHYCFSDCEDSSVPEAHMFVEYQDGNDETLAGELFYAREFKNDGCKWAKNVEEGGGSHFTRLWLLTSPCEWADADGSLNGPNLPATNFPYFGWYARYTHDLKAIPDFGFKTISWNKYDTPRKGSNPDVAVNNLGHVVEVHKSQHHDQLYYSIGNISDDGNSINWDTENQNYTGGTTPSVAIVDHLNDQYQLLLVEVHVDGGNNLYYRFGLIDTKELDGKRILTGTITWQGENWTHYDNGKHPSVAINEDNMVVEVHEGSDFDLWYNVGGFNTQGDFAWATYSADRNYNKKGDHPTVALHGNLIFEAHNSFDDFANLGYLWCRIGSLNADLKKIDWKNPDSNETTYSYPIDQAESWYPSVALYSSGAVEAHKTNDGIWWRTGKTSNSVMAVGPTKDIQDVLFDSGYPPGASGTKISIDASDTHVVLSYISGDSEITYMVGQLE